MVRTMAHVTLPDESGYVVATATAGQTVFSFDFVVWEKANLRVFQNGTELALSAWTPTFNTGTDGGFDGGTVTLNTGASEDDRIEIIRLVNAFRNTDFSAGGFDFDALNTEFDKIIARLKDLQHEAARSLRLPVDETEQLVPSATDRASTALAFDASGNVELIARTNLEELGARLSEIDALSTAARLAAIDAIYADLTGDDTIGDAAALLAVVAPGLVAKQSDGTPVSVTLQAQDGLAWDNADAESGNPSVKVGDPDALRSALEVGTLGELIFTAEDLTEFFSNAGGADFASAVDGQVWTKSGSGMAFVTPAGAGDVLLAASQTFTNDNKFASGLIELENATGALRLKASVGGDDALSFGRSATGGVVTVRRGGVAHHTISALGSVQWNQTGITTHDSIWYGAVTNGVPVEVARVDADALAFVFKGDVDFSLMTNRAQASLALTRVVTVDLLADMVALTAGELADVATVQCLGATAVLDGFEGFFEILDGNAAANGLTADGATVIDIAGGAKCAQRRWVGPVRADWFQLETGTGAAADNAPKFEALMNAAIVGTVANGSEYAIEFPNATYYCDVSVYRVEVPPNCIVRGQGMNSSQIGLTNWTNGPGMLLMRYRDDKQFFWFLQDIHIFSTGSTDQVEISAIADNGSGEIRVTATGHGLVANQPFSICGAFYEDTSVTPVRKIIHPMSQHWAGATIIDADTIDLPGSTYAALTNTDISQARINKHPAEAITNIEASDGAGSPIVVTLGRNHTLSDDDWIAIDFPNVMDPTTVDGGELIAQWEVQASGSVTGYGTLAANQLLLKDSIADGAITYNAANGQAIGFTGTTTIYCPQSQSFGMTRVRLNTGLQGATCASLWLEGKRDPTDGTIDGSSSPVYHGDTTLAHFVDIDVNRSGYCAVWMGGPRDPDEVFDSFVNMTTGDHGYISNQDGKGLRVLAGVHGLIRGRSVQCGGTQIELCDAQSWSLDWTIENSRAEGVKFGPLSQNIRYHLHTGGSMDGAVLVDEGIANYGTVNGAAPERGFRVPFEPSSSGPSVEKSIIVNQFGDIIYTDDDRVAHNLMLHGQLLSKTTTGSLAASFQGEIASLNFDEDGRLYVMGAGCVVFAGGVDADLEVQLRRSTDTAGNEAYTRSGKYTQNHVALANFAVGPSSTPIWQVRTKNTSASTKSAGISGAILLRFVPGAS